MTTMTNNSNNNNTLMELLQCPLCHEAFSIPSSSSSSSDNNQNNNDNNKNNNNKNDHRLPTSCRWCFHTICSQCVNELHRHKHSTSGVATFTSHVLMDCPKCGAGNAFHGNVPVRHEFSCQLLEQLQSLVQSQQQQHDQVGPPQEEPQPTVAAVAKDPTTDTTAPAPPSRDDNDNKDVGLTLGTKNLQGRSLSPATTTMVSTAAAATPTATAKVGATKTPAAPTITKPKSSLPEQSNDNNDNDHDNNEHMLGFAYSPGTLLYRDGHWGTIHSVHDTLEYLLQFDPMTAVAGFEEEEDTHPAPQWVGTKEMKQAVVDAAATAAGDTRHHPTAAVPATLVETSSSSPSSSFVGCRVYKELVGGGCFWGRVQACRLVTTYGIVLDDDMGEEQVEEQACQTEIEAMVMAADRHEAMQAQEEEEEEERGRIMPTRQQQRRTNNSMSAGNMSMILIDDECIVPPKTPLSIKKRRAALLEEENQDSQKSFVLTKYRPKRTKTITSSSKTRTVTPINQDDGQVILVDKKKNHDSSSRVTRAFALPPQARGTGWVGFDQYITDWNLPASLQSIIQLLDFLFPIASTTTTTSSFVQALWKNTDRYRKRGIGGGQVTCELRRLQKEPHTAAAQALQWHDKPRKKWIPPTKEDLRSFLELLMNLDFSPTLQNPNDAHYPNNSGKTSSSSSTSSLKSNQLGTHKGRSTKSTAVAPRNVHPIFGATRALSSKGVHPKRNSSRRAGQAPAETPYCNAERSRGSKRSKATPSDTEASDDDDNETESSDSERESESHSDDDGSEDDYTESDSERNTNAGKIIQIGKALLLPVSMKGSGWKGFGKHYCASKDAALPKQFREVIQLMDFLFPVAPGEGTFIECLYNDNNDPGKKARQQLKELKSKYPDCKGLQWHQHFGRYVPPTKKDLASFMDLLLGLDGAPQLEDPTLRIKNWPSFCRDDNGHDDESTDDSSSSSSSSSSSLASSQGMVYTQNTDDKPGSVSFHFSAYGKSDRYSRPLSQKILSRGICKPF